MWSFGVVLWELFSYASALPYQDKQTPEEIIQAVRLGVFFSKKKFIAFFWFLQFFLFALLILLVPTQVCSGEKLPCPPNCPSGVYQVMLRCWQQQPQDRPTFKEVFAQLNHFASQAPADTPSHMFVSADAQTASYSISNYVTTVAYSQQSNV